MGVNIRSRRSRMPFDLSERRTYRFRVMPSPDETFNVFSGLGDVWRSKKSLSDDQERIDARQEKLDKLGVVKDGFDKASAVLGGVASIAEKSMSLAEIADTSEIEGGIEDTANSDYTSAGSNRSLLSQWNSTKWQRSDYDWRDVRGMSGGEMAGQIGGATIDGAMAGLQAGGPWGAVAGAAVGLGSSLGGMFAGNRKARRKAEELNDAAAAANRDATNAFTQANSQLAQQSFNAQMANLSAYGGAVDRWRALPLADRSRLIGLYVRNGVSDLVSMRSHYNAMAYGGERGGAEDAPEKDEPVGRPLSPAATLIGGERGRLIDEMMYGGRRYSGTDDTDVDAPPVKYMEKPAYETDPENGRIVLDENAAQGYNMEYDYPELNSIGPAASVSAKAVRRREVKGLADEMHAAGLSPGQVSVYGSKERKNGRLSGLLTRRMERDERKEQRARIRLEDKLRSIYESDLPEGTKEMLALSEMPDSVIIEQTRKGNPVAGEAAAHKGIENYGVPIALGSTLIPAATAFGLGAVAPWIADTALPAVVAGLNWAAGTAPGQTLIATAGSPITWGALAVGDAAEKTYRNIRYDEPITWNDVAQTGVDMALATLPFEKALGAAAKGYDALKSGVRRLPASVAESFNWMLTAPERKAVTEVVKKDFEKMFETYFSEMEKGFSGAAEKFGMSDLDAALTHASTEKEGGTLYSSLTPFLTTGNRGGKIARVSTAKLKPFTVGKVELNVPGIGEVNFKLDNQLTGKAKLLTSRNGTRTVRFMKIKDADLKSYDKAVSDIDAAIRAKYPGAKLLGSSSVRGVSHDKHDMDYFISSTDFIGQGLNSKATEIRRGNTYRVVDPEFGEVDFNIIWEGSDGKAFGDNALELYRQFFNRSYSAQTAALAKANGKVASKDIKIPYSASQLLSAYDPSVKTVLDVLESNKAQKHPARTFGYLALAPIEDVEKAVELYCGMVLPNRIRIPNYNASNAVANKTALGMMCFPIDVSEDPRRVNAIFKYFTANSLFNNRGVKRKEAVDLLSNIVVAPYNGGSLLGGGVNSAAGGSSMFIRDLNTLIPIDITFDASMLNTLEKLKRKTGFNYVFTETDARMINDERVKKGMTAYEVLSQTAKDLEGLEPGTKNFDIEVKRCRELFEKLRSIDIYALRGDMMSQTAKQVLAASKTRKIELAGAPYSGLVDYVVKSLDDIKFIDETVLFGSYWGKLDRAFEANGLKVHRRGFGAILAGSTVFSLCGLAFVDYAVRRSNAINTGEPDFESAENAVAEILERLHETHPGASHGYYMMMLNAELRERLRENGFPDETGFGFGDYLRYGKEKLVDGAVGVYKFAEEYIKGLVEESDDEQDVEE